MTERRRIAIVGGGISGLAAAYRLGREVATGAEIDVTLIEAGARLGGKIQTEHLDGFTIEAGPDSFLASKPAATRLCQELGLGDRLIGTRPDGGGTFILRDGRLEPLPEGITMLVPTRLGPILRSRLLSPRGKLRLAWELFVPPKRDGGDESVASFVRRRFGREAFDHMAQPLLSGIHGGDAEQLSILSTFPRLRESEQRYGSLVRAMLAQRRAAPARPAPSGSIPRSAFLSLKGGMGDLVDALASALDGVDVRCKTSVESIARRETGGYRLRLGDGAALEADAVILATPAWASAGMLEDLAPDLARTLRAIPYTSSATVALAYRAADIAGLGGGRGFVVPRVEQRELSAVTWVSSKFAGRAPEGMALVRGFVGGAGREAVVDLGDDLLIGVVRGELQAILGLEAEPVLTRVHRWRQAQPQYTLGHAERLKAIDRALGDLPGLRLAGASYRGVGIPDCIESGEAAAAAVLRGADTTSGVPV